MLFPGVDATIVNNWESGDWATQDYITNPGSGVLFADTGELAVGIYDFDIVLSANVLSGAYLEHRNAANGANIKRHFLICPVTTMSTRLQIRGLKIAADERLRAISSGAWVGVVQVTIWWVQRVKGL